MRSEPRIGDQTNCCNLLHFVALPWVRKSPCRLAPLPLAPLKVGLPKAGKIGLNPVPRHRARYARARWMGSCGMDRHRVRLCAGPQARTCMAHPTQLPSGAPLVRLELRHGSANPTFHDLPGEEFLLGSVPGCDLRIPGANLPPIIAQFVRRPDGLRIRKLAPTQPIFLNGQPVVTQASLANGDRLQIGPVDIQVHLTMSSAPARRPEPAAVSFVPIPPQPQLPIHGAHVGGRPDPNLWQPLSHDAADQRDRQRQLDEQARELESDRVIWYRRREEIEREIQSAAAHQQQVQAEARQVQDLRLQVQNREKELEQRLHDFTARVHSFEPRLAELESRERALFAREAQLAQAAERTTKATSEMQTAQNMQSQYQADLVRIDRLQVLLAQKEQEMDAKNQEIERRYVQMQRDAHELEEQARLLDGGQVRLKDEAQRLTRQKSDQEALTTQLSERAAMLEGQQAMIAALRTRMDRLKEELRQQAQQLALDRTQQDDLTKQLKLRLDETIRLKSELDAESSAREHERAAHAEHNATLQEALSRIKQLQEELDAKDKQLQARATELEAQGATQIEQTGMLRARAQQLLELQQRNEADRQSIRDREAALTQAEEARKALQEQLLRRNEELLARAKAIEEHAQGLGGKQADMCASTSKSVRNGRRRRNDSPR